jgi:hypothetical protein
MEPIDHSLDVQWSVDGVDIPGATGLTFTPTSLLIGIHDVALTAVDNTTRVREDTARATWLTDTRQWQIEVGPEPDPNANLNGDSFVDFFDFAIFASQFGARDCCSPDWCKGADFEPDFDVDYADLSVLTEQWLTATTIPPLPSPASNPSPSDSAIGVSTTADLSWTAGSDATLHDIYFGTSSPPPFIDNQTDTIFDPGTMGYVTMYYWRIDSVNSWGITKGEVWSFRTTGSGPG